VLDSEYVSRGITEWLPRWIANGWRAGGRRARPLKNVRLWQRLAEQLQRHEVDCQWVRGHSGHKENELVDELARAVAMRQASMEV
jgi:ribonuclease HI